MAVRLMKTKTFFRALSATGNFFQHFLLLAFRLYWGYAFMQAGLKKFTAIDETIAFFSQLSLPFPLANAYAVASFETVGGILLIIGLASRLIAIPLSIIMIVALLTAHAKGTFQILSNPQIFLNESPITFLMATLVIFVCGAGWFSLDYLIGRYFGRGERT